MKQTVHKLILLLLLSTLAVVVSAVNIKYVTQKGAGLKDGSSWTNAYDSTGLQTAINTLAANGGGQVWVAKGNYYPTEDETGNKNPTDPRMKTFSLKKGVAVYGGFVGTETNVSQRSSSSDYFGILSGDIGVKSSATDNVYNVIYSYDADSSAFIEGFKIRYGNANGTGIERTQNGGGAYLNGGCISACVITSNNALKNGAGVYINKKGSVVHCKDVGTNNCTGNGGGIYLNEGGLVDDCILSKCSGTETDGSGGGIYCYGMGIIRKTEIKDCKAQKGGGICAVGSSIKVDSCTISACTAIIGGGLYASGSNVLITNTSLTKNVTSKNSQAKGGGAYCENGVKLFGCNVKFNTCDSSSTSLYHNGGGLFMDNSTVENSTIAGNICTKGEGAGIFAQNSSIIKGSLIFNNAATTGKILYPTTGGVYIEGSGSKIVNSTIVNNAPTPPSSNTFQVFVNSVTDGTFDIVNSILATISRGYNSDSDYGDKHLGKSVSSQFIINKRNNILGLESPHAIFTNPTFYIGVSTLVTEATINATDWTPNRSWTPSQGVKHFIDKGTADTAGLSLSAKDIYGKDRIFNDTIDPGACEYVSRYFVTITGAGTKDGSSWENALSAAKIIGKASLGAEMWIASGVYTSSSTAMSNLLSGGRIFGGFKGNENAISERELKDMDGNGVVEPWEFANSTILDGQKTCKYIVSSVSSINGVTLTGATDAAVYNTAVLKKCVIKNALGGGFYSAIQATVSDCFITQNSSIKGGGVYMPAGGTVERCKITQNTANIGGGIFMGGNTGVIKNCELLGNAATGAGATGAGIYIESDGSVHNTIVQNNTSAETGGGVVFKMAGDMINCVITNNSATASGGVSMGSTYCRLINSTLANNAGTNLKTDANSANNIVINTVVAGDNAIGSKAIIQNCAFTDATRGTGGLLFSTTNTEIFKQATSFVGAAKTDEQRKELEYANWSLHTESPLINTGALIDATVKQLTTDISGGVRVAFDKIDIGAYELQNIQKPESSSSVTVAQPKEKTAVFSWKKVAGVAGYIVFVKQSSTSIALPIAGQNYVADTVWGTFASMASDGWYAVYAGKDTSAAISGLTPGAWYRVQVNSYVCDKFKTYSATTEGKNIVNFFAKQAQTITFSAPTSIEGKNEYQLTAFSTSGLPITYSLPTSSKDMIVDGRLVLDTVPATVTITASQAGDPARYYAATAVSQTIAFKKAAQTISFATLPSKTFGDADFTLAATSNSGLPITYTSNNTKVATVVNNVVHIVAGGTAIITASQAGGEVYVAAQPKSQKLFIAAKTQAMVFDTIYPITTETSIVIPSATAESGQKVEFAVSPESVASEKDSKLYIKGKGTAIVTAKVAGDSSYKAVSATRILSVGKGSQTISFLPLSVKTYGASAFELEASSSSGLSVALSCSNSAIAAISGTTVTIKKAGTVQITASQAGNKNYDAASSVTRSLTILPASQTITFDSLAVYPFSANLKITPKVSITSGRKARLTSYDLSVAKIVNDTTIVVVGAGKTIITASHDGDSCYAQAAPVQRELVITKIPQSLKFTKTTAAVYGQSDIALNDTASSKLKTVVSSSDINVVSIVNGKLHIAGAGKAVITISQAGNNVYESVDSVFTFTVAQATQKILFAPIANRSIADGDVFPVVKATSGLLVTLKTDTDTVAKIENGIIKIVGTGTVTITASQAGNDNYETAKDSSITFKVLKTTQSIVFTTLPTVVYGDTKTLTLDGFATSKLAVSYTSSNQKVATIKDGVVTILGVGNTIITASQAGDGNYEAAGDKQQVLSVLKMSQRIDTITAFVDTVAFDNQLLTVRDTSTRALKLGYQSSNESVAVITKEGKVQIVGAGTTIISAHQNGNDTVDAAKPLEHRLVVLQKIQSITVQANASVEYGSKDFELVIAGNKSTVTLQSQTPNVVQIVNGKLHIVGVDTALIRITQEAVAGYKAIDTVVKIIISKAKDSVYFKPLANKLVGQQSFRLFATSKSGQAVTYSSSNSAIASVTENEVTISGSGQCVITAAVAESDNFKAAATARSFTVSAMDVLKLPAYTITRDTVIDLNSLRLNTDEFDYSFVATKHDKLHVVINNSLATITPIRSASCWTGVDTLWFKAVNKATPSDSVTFGVKINRNRFADQIGLVTTDSLTGTYNIIAWEPKQKAATDAWVVYRRGESLSQWDSLGQVAATDTAVFADKKVNTKQQAYQYALVTKDSTGCKSPMSAPHTTMHLKTGVSLQNYPQLWWSAYEGVEVESYIIYRENVQTNKFEEIGSTFLTSFTDQKPNGTNNYRVAIKFANWITPTRLKTDTGPFSQSFSNMSEASLVDVTETSIAVGVTAYPNPASNVLNIEATDAIEAIEFVAADGRVVKQLKEVSANKLEVPVKDLTAGLYSVVVTTAAGVETVKIQCGN